MKANESLFADPLRQRSWNKALRIARAAGGELNKSGVYSGTCDRCGVHLDGLWTVAVASPFHPSFPNVFCVECCRRGG